ncbi:MAG: aldo/keto reductase [Phycisphaeraceae bacterium]
MQYRTLGRTGLHVSDISLGSWLTFGQSVDDAATEACMVAAYDLGVNFFDGAEAYGAGKAELAMGRVFKKTGWARDTFIVSSKVIQVGPKPTQRGLSRKHLVEACDAALGRMGLDHLDLFFCHRPDPTTPLDEIVHTMNELIQRGKIFYWGTSEFSAGDLHELYAIAQRDHLVGPSMEQTVHSMLNRKRVDGELRSLFDRHGLGTTIYSPLAQGVLTGKYNDGVPEDSRLAKRGEEAAQRQLAAERLEVVRKLTAIAGELDMSMAQLALAWCLKNPNVSTAIVGATRPSQVEDNAAAADATERLTNDVMERIETLLDNRP